VLLHVLVETPLYSEGPLSGHRTREVYKAAAAWAEKELAGWARGAHDAGLTVRTVVKTGAPHDVIVAVATELGADLIVLGTHGRGGINRALLGSVADRVVRLAACPVITVRERAA
jgi:nucleotide-binding universal stress UspA family protein